MRWDFLLINAPTSEDGTGKEQGPGSVNSNGKIRKSNLYVLIPPTINSTFPSPFSTSLVVISRVHVWLRLGGRKEGLSSKWNTQQ